MASDPTWPAFGTEALAWESSDAEYGPRTGRSHRRGPYEAALPARIADAELRLDGATTALVAEASAEIARLDGESLGSLMSFASLLLRTEAASSSQIENLTSSPKAIALAELGRRGRANADEIVANVGAMTRALDVADRLDTDAILAMHRVLMRDHMPDAAGQWRDSAVWIGGSARSPHGADYVAPRSALVPDAMEDLMRFVARDDLPALAQVAVAHAQFENIHPFPDGNGRTGRALMHAQLRHAALTRHVVVPISAGLLAETDRYFAALTAYRTGDPVPIVVRVCEAVFPALQGARLLMDDVSAARERWATSVRARRGASAWRLADALVERPVIDSRLAAELLGVTMANAQSAIDRLVEDGVLDQIGRGARDRVWQAVEVIEAMERFADRAHRRTG
ncbi:Fic family protein [Cellulosimicrobium arenosum]|uniref:Fic family protein n=1 Tax=Cellulosimicrobium arenosum TaxID=2708133 RepID=A0A927G750_9MICO|nr:Fic family protein [Cellulosimicrobium arenosum]MBD8078166.1 Fic family protein [Cellulosimicrobium arenosum]